MEADLASRGFWQEGEKRVLALTIAFVYLLMVFGNIVTSTGSGLACPDWPLCYGTVAPPRHLAVWIEWGHRLIGGVTGILILLSAALLWKSAAMKFFLKLAVGLLLLAVGLGGMIIIVEAPLLDSVFRIVVVSSHIVVATVIFATMIIACRPARVSGGEGKRGYQLGLFALVYFQVVLGIVVRYSRSSLACPDWPLCQGGLLPPEYSPAVLLHYTHRLAAYSIFLLTLWKLAEAKRSGGPLFRPGVTFGLVSLQASIGIGIVLSQMFLPLLVMHGAVGFLLLGWVTWQGAPYLVASAPAAERV